MDAHNHDTDTIAGYVGAVVATMIGGLGAVARVLREPLSNGKMGAGFAGGGVCGLCTFAAMWYYYPPRAGGDMVIHMAASGFAGFVSIELILFVLKLVQIAKHKGESFAGRKADSLFPPESPTHAGPPPPGQPNEQPDRAVPAPPHPAGERGAGVLQTRSGGATGAEAGADGGKAAP
jgi:hypothetical protein